LLVGIDAVDADADDGRLALLVLSEVTLEIVGFNRATGRHILRIKVQNDPLTFEVVKAYRLAFLRAKREIRRLAPNGRHLRGHQARAGDQRQASQHRTHLRDHFILHEGYLAYSS
jgi:hypothetical protein